MILQNWQGVYKHIERLEFKAGDDVNGNNVMEGDANNRSNVYNDDNCFHYRFRCHNSCGVEQMPN